MRQDKTIDDVNMDETRRIWDDQTVKSKKKQKSHPGSPIMEIKRRPRRRKEEDDEDKDEDEDENGEAEEEKKERRI